MQLKKFNSKTYLVRIERGEYLIKTLTQFCKDQKIKGGFFSGLGAVDDLELAFYNVDTKKYFTKKINQPFELTNLTGTIGIDISKNDNKGLIIHTHVTLSDEKMNSKGGHLVDARVTGTTEIYLKVLPKLVKNFDDQTGLKLFNLENKINFFSLIFKIIKILIITALSLVFLIIILWQLDTRFNLISNLLKPKHPDLGELFNNKNRPEIPKDEVTCLAQNGVWRKIGISPREECNLPTQDGGKICKDVSECEVACLANFSKDELSQGMNGKVLKKNGTCASWYTIVGCRGFVKKGKAYTICID